MFMKKNNRKKIATLIATLFVLTVIAFPFLYKPS